MLTILLKVLFPTFCIGCNQYGDLLCHKCQAFLYRTNPECLNCRRISNSYATHDNCKNDSQYISSAYTCFIYNWLGKKIMKKLKFEGVTSMRELLIQKVTPQIFGITNCLNSTGPPAYLIPIPIYRKRLLDRGYNQVSFFARFLEKQNIGEVKDNLLIKAHNSKSQSHKLLGERGYHGENPFIVNSQSKITFISNKDPTFILVDDVLTTGNTLIMAAKALKEQFPTATIKALALFRPVYKGEKDAKNTSSAELDVFGTTISGPSTKC